MAEAYRWLFVDHIPLLYDEKKVARQVQVEAWLDLAQVMKELGIERLNENKQNAHTPSSYIV